jgi:hypothetical protein
MYIKLLSDNKIDIGQKKKEYFLGVKEARNKNTTPKT